ncbi:hypothetical protein PUN28_008021 [Cardiocondyla obscurior]|uniref:CHK kinase-like domain-containing protein n=2 Tax=Cardiocondyla obscurior TaxID=286306 RepID=A0AAW2FY75_9HYME
MSHAEGIEKSNKEVITKIIEGLKQNGDEVRCEFSKQNVNIMSNIYYICVKFKRKTNGQSEKLSVLLKRPIQIEEIREMVHNDFQFHNEILFYRMYAQPNDNFARCFYIDERPPTDSVIVLENVNERGYYSCPRTYHVPLEYTLAAMREMGRFHGKGYAMKVLQREKFFAIVKQLQEARFDTAYPFKDYIDIIATRTVEYLRERDYDAAFCDKMEATFSQAFTEVMMKTVEPLEPLSTLCHGDFTANNVLFKTEENGQCRAILIDFAFIRYSTPVVDLSTYICLSCSDDMMREKFFEIIRAYHDALKDYLLEAGIWDAEKYSYEALLDDYRRGALFGFIIATYFLPVLMGYETAGFETLTNVSYDERAHRSKQLGGDDMSKILADMLLCLKELGCLKQYF